MIKLPSEFVENADKTGTQTFKLIKRTDKVALYQRIRKDNTTFAWEVFRIKVIKKGTVIYDKVLEDDKEQYGSVTKKKFGRYDIHCCKFLDQAEAIYDRLNKEFDDSTDEEELDSPTPERGNNDAPKRGRKAKQIKMPIPCKGEKFTMKKLMLISGESQPNLYVRLKSLLEQQLVSIVGEVREANTRGRAQVVYQSNTDQFAEQVPTEITIG